MHATICNTDLSEQRPVSLRSLILFGTVREYITIYVCVICTRARVHTNPHNNSNNNNSSSLVINNASNGKYV